MNALVTYWFVGCVLTGAAYGLRYNECKTLPEIGVGTLYTVSVWPVSIGLAWQANETPTRGCP